MADTGLESIDQLIKLLAGTKTTTTNTADNSGLEAILQQALGGGGDQQALLATLFQQAGAKIPGIMGNTYNASGSRQAPGKLAPQLAQMQMQLATAAQAQIAQQKAQQLQTAVQAAGTISNNSRQQVVQQANGGLSTTQKIAKLLGGNDAIRKLTNIDLIGSGRDLIKKKTAGLFDDTAASNSAAGGLSNVMAGTFNSANPFNFDTTSPLAGGLGGGVDFGSGGVPSAMDYSNFGGGGGFDSGGFYNYDTSINDNISPIYNSPSYDYYGGGGVNLGSGGGGGLSIGDYYNGYNNDPGAFSNFFGSSNGGFGGGFSFNF